MADRTILTARWRAGELHLLTVDPFSGKTTPVSRLPDVVDSSQRFFITMTATRPGLGWLIAPNQGESGCFRLAASGAHLLAMPGLPEGLTPREGSSHIHVAGDLLTVIADNRIFAIDAGREWRELECPGGVEIRDVSFGQDGTTWIAASRANRPDTEARAPVLFQQSASGKPFEEQPLKLGSARAYLARKFGGWESIDRLDVEAWPLLAVADRADFHEHPGAILLTRGEDAPWRLEQLPGDRIRCLLRPSTGEAVAVGVTGSLHRLARDGRLTASSTSQALGETLGKWMAAGEPALFTIRAAQAMADGILAIVGLHTNREDRLVWLLNALCLTRDLGSSWTVLDTTRPVAGEEELAAVAYI